MESTVALDAHQVLRGQHAKSLTHHPDADPEAPGKVVGLEPLARAEPTVEYVVAQLRVYVDHQGVGTGALGHWKSLTVVK
jgi:hypothetical protein